MTVRTKAEQNRAYVTLKKTIVENIEKAECRWRGADVIVARIGGQLN